MTNNLTSRSSWINYLLIFLGACEILSSVRAFDMTHSKWTIVLKTHSNDGNVDYKTLKQNSTLLDSYLTSIAELTSNDFESWKNEDQLACLINLYNAATIRLVLDEYPVKSIKDIGFLPHAAWRRKFVSLWGGQVSLNHIEHELIRPRAKSHPEIHFALVCAAKGCPPLITEAYTGDQLIKQLHDQGRTFLSNTSKNRVNRETRTLHLSPIFDWYKDDFELNADSINEYLTTSFPKLIPPEARHFSIKWTEYDWDLNGL
jgi:hypothetical protein